ncbi:hypothetical protein GGH94_002203 [Coemansia aciculifera]|uniref:RGS domain-containing protein n=1 Tax=Coemansia aciculifera TaxID=417176 RepID=A0A9W8M698_9FUNG|nr:hypothetical protein GGH94_002203 [Coemansia aciculifera]
MLDLEAEFEAMMANVTAPPLSLDEFRLFVACDSKARNALAFCEWYQRYRTVYFDRVPVPSTRMTTASSRPEIPLEFARAGLKPAHTDHVSTMSLCLPSMRVHGQRAQALDRLYALKSHSFSALSESIVDSAFNTASTGASGGLSASRRPAVLLEPGQPTDSSLFTHHTWQLGKSRCDAQVECAARSSHGNIARRRTLPLAASDLGLGYELRAQEDNRQHIQSLLIVECWARFLDDMALEHVDIPQTELLYIKERLPLTITRIPRPLLCQGDMLASVALAANYDKHWLEQPLSQTAQPSAGAGSRRLATHRSLQLWPYEQLKRSLASQVRQHKAVLARTQSPLSLCFGTADVDTTSNHGGSDEPLTSKPIRKLRRISTMPALMPGADIHRAAAHMPASITAQQLPRPTRAQRLISLGELQMYHSTLKPRPPFATTVSGCTGAMQACGYQPVPRSLGKLVVPSSIPPALFDTAAKLSADYLLQYHFAEFQKQAHFNLTQREQKLAAALSVALFLAGAGAAAALVLAKAPLAWRIFAVLPLFLSAVYISAAWTRVSISMWWQRKRPTSLIRRAYTGHIGDCEAPDHVEYTSDIKLRSIRMITGTFVPFFPAGFIGAIHSTSGCSRSYGHTRPQIQPAKGFTPAPIGTISAISLWSQSTIPAAVGNVFGLLVRAMLRSRAVGDHWFVDLDSRLYEVAEPIVLYGQCYIVGYQLAIVVVMCAAFATILFVLP